MEPEEDELLEAQETDEEENEMEENEDPAFIEVLPTEMLVHIFSFLDVKQRVLCERVCKRWRWVSKELHWLWPRNLSIDMRKAWAVDSAIEAVLTRSGCCVRTLELINSITNEELRASSSLASVGTIGRFCPNIRSLTLVGFMFTHVRMKVLAEKCTKLKTLCIRYGSRINEEGLAEFIELAHGLEYLFIDAPIVGKCFTVVGPKLKSLTVRSYALQPIALENVMFQCANLIELRLTACKVDLGTLRRCFELYKFTLKILEFEKWYGVNWCECLRTLGQIQELSLTYCSGVDDILMNMLSRSFSRLVKLSICCTGSLVSDKGLTFLCTIPCLKVLNVSDNTTIVGSGIRDLATQGQLEELYASATLLREEYLYSLARWCPNIRILDVRWNRQLSNGLITVFSEAINDGILTQPVKLFVKGTSITESSKCDLLEVDFLVQLSCSRFRRSTQIPPNYVIL